MNRSTKFERTAAVCCLIGFFCLCVAANHCGAYMYQTQQTCIRNGGHVIGDHCIQRCPEGK